MDLGYDAKYIEMRLYDGLKGMYNYLKTVSGRNNPILFAKAINLAIRKMFLLDDLEDALSYYRAREVNLGDAEKNYNKALE